MIKDVKLLLLETNNNRKIQTNTQGDLRDNSGNEKDIGRQQHDTTHKTGSDSMLPISTPLNTVISANVATGGMEGKKSYLLMCRLG